MQAAFYSINGGPDVVRYGNVPDPVLGPNEVLVRVQSVSIEGGDIISRRFGHPFGRILLRP